MKYFQLSMCTIIVTIRSVLWAVMTIVGTLMILVALFTNRWLHGREHMIPRGTGEQLDAVLCRSLYYIENHIFSTPPFRKS